MTTDDKQTTDPTAPALLSAARLAKARAAADAFDDAHAGSGEEQDAAYDAAQFVGPLLRHLAALTPPATPDGEALGRMLAGLMADHMGSAADPLGYNAAALALRANGYARGRSEGEAERARLRDDVRRWSKLYSEGAALLADRDATIARLTAELAAAHDRALAHGVAVVASTERAMQVQIDALPAELAEARDEAEENRRTVVKIAQAGTLDVRAARLDGAREERRRCMADAQEVEDEARGNGEAGAVAGALRVKMAIRARGEGRGPAIAREPAPTANSNRAIWPLLIAETAAGHYGGDTPEKRHLLADMAARHAYGVEHYGTPLQAHNGRDALIDAYQEALDLPAYLRQAQEEGKLPRSNGLVSNAVHIALCIRMHLDDLETGARGEGQGS